MYIYMSTYLYVYISGLCTHAHLYIIQLICVICRFHIWGFAFLLNFISNPTNTCNAFPVTCRRGHMRGSSSCVHPDVCVPSWEHS